MRGNYDEIIKQILMNRPSKYQELKREEQAQEGYDPLQKPPVWMEPGMTEDDYPPTDKYDYVPYEEPSQDEQNQYIQEELLREQNDTIEKRPPTTRIKSRRR